MSATILSGIVARDARIPILVEQVKALSRAPKLTIIQVGDRPDSTAYINAKKSFAQKIGVSIDYVHLVTDVSEDVIINNIKAFNSDPSVSGIIVQLPLPVHISAINVIEAINPSKDVDGLTEINQRKMNSGDVSAVIPGTARGVMELLAYYSIDLRGKKVAVVGRSRLVGTPIAVLCKRAGAEVIVCHSKTADLAHETSQADILIVAVGKPGLIGAKHVKKGAVVIDVGISKLADGHIKGDVDFDSVKDLVSAVTPVPGGVGPMTVQGLFENVIDASVRQ